METGSYHLRFTHIHNAQREPRLHSYKLFLLGHFIAITTFAFYHWQIPIDPTRHQENCKTPVRSRTDTNTILFENCLFFYTDEERDTFTASQCILGTNRVAGAANDLTSGFLVVRFHLCSSSLPTCPCPLCTRSPTTYNRTP